MRCRCLFARAIFVCLRLFNYVAQGLVRESESTTKCGDNGQKSPWRRASIGYPYGIKNGPRLRRPLLLHSDAGPLATNLRYVRNNEACCTIVLGQLISFYLVPCLFPPGPAGELVACASRYDVTLQRTASIDVRSRPATCGIVRPISNKRLMPSWRSRESGGRRCRGGGKCA